MKLQAFKTLLCTAATLGVLALTGSQAQAFQVGGWNYAIDSFNDGTEWDATNKRLVVGQNSDFEFFGMAFRVLEDRVVFAINSNLSLNGYDLDGARNKKISYGDLVLNFTNTASFDAAQSSLFAIRFDSTNDTNVKVVTETRTIDSRGRAKVTKTTRTSPLGLYGGVTTNSLTNVNSGYSSHQQHTTEVAKVGGSASLGDLDANNSYFAYNTAAQTNMKSGSYLGGINMLGAADFRALGLNFGNFSATGNYTFGFSVDRSLLPVGNFMASLFAECGNDGIVMAGSTAVPEPTTMAGTAIAAGLMYTRRRRKKQEASA
ncbi:MAG: hypothetical protein Fur0046_09950 [Cyanobacteria bacterium J069]|nr:MAG: PEP-CTERM sorting domain-containing protein [Cyanobacteria bacterium J069]